VTTRTRTALKWTAFGLLVALSMLWAAGAFHRGRAHTATSEADDSPAPGATAVAERLTRPLHEDAMGTIESRRRVVIAAQVTGRILTVDTDVGRSVDAGAPLLSIDARDLEAAFAQAKAHHARTARFLAKGAATRADMEAAETAFVQARTALGHARITAPIAGVVAERHVEAGDLAWPGRPLLVVLDPTALRLTAAVREGLIATVAPGTTLRVDLPAAATSLDGTVSEIQPSADPQSRTFTVRVDLPAAEGIHPGMFGRLRLPVGEREVVRVPADAVARVGQLETVRTRIDDRWQRRLVTTGTRFEDGTVEVLSGLTGGETIARGEAPR